MKRLLYFFICFGLLIFWSSCRNDFEFTPSTGSLEFERDTVYLDTVFNNIGSSTYSLKVYNRSDDDIAIPVIQLERGTASFYRMNVDGGTGDQGMPQEGKFFENVELLANDSLFIFIETTIDFSTQPTLDTEFLYTDRILFDTGSNEQDVDLVTLVRDAVFIYPDFQGNSTTFENLNFDVDGDGIVDETSLSGRFLNTNELTFTNEKPYVIYGYAATPEGETLTIEAGARLHFHTDSGLLITNNSTLNINGSTSTDPELLENEVIIEGDRLEPFFEDVPGQWGTIYLFNGSTNNTINYATIKNATIGILVEGNDDAPNDKLTITNSQIYNTSSFGILGRTTSITGENVVINNSGQSSFAGTVGGKYNFTHCTISNYWNTSFRQFPALLLNDFAQVDETTIATNPLTEANFNNCIIYGNDNPEFILDQQGDDFSFKFTNCLLRFNNNNLEGTTNYVFSESNFYESNIFNEDPDFEAPFDNLMRIGEDSGANGIGSTLFSMQVPFDLLGTSRAVTPDAGAYESVVLDD
ncbi:MAG: hypothetical protein HKP48_08465 [Winogradskyella sp.]|uniref:hypothetical protein n=1 Tax=Winogradskyella sp. TaxID=1883156 RepID=UPI0017DFB6DA|nr:hypothetical protein [Winogradskyella sp.]MBT8244380.1 hypothetical protein [Winogradskyella sp.]NNK23307.1 hypothetical protein [Winogradskyella sp.]